MLVKTFFRRLFSLFFRRIFSLVNIQGKIFEKKTF